MRNEGNSIAPDERDRIFEKGSIEGPVCEILFPAAGSACTSHVRSLPRTEASLESY